MSGTIIVGIDGSSRGLEALALGRRLAEASGAALLVAAAYEPEIYPPAEDEIVAPRTAAKEALAQARAALGGFTAWEPRLLAAGSPAAALHRLAEREEADLVVVGSTHRGALGRVLPGSVGERLLHGSRCPVAVTPHGYEAPARDGLASVAAGFDGSQAAQAVVAVAADLATALDARLRLVRALPIPSPTNPAFGTMSYHETVEAMRRNALEATHAAAAELPAELGLETRVVDGEPVDVLADVSRDADLLVLGSRGHGPLRRVLLGGVSGALLERAACPVIVVPRGAKRPFGGLVERRRTAAGIGDERGRPRAGPRATRPRP
jgi:nucleotide-binding universal stress UspA family protein